MVRLAWPFGFAYPINAWSGAYPWGRRAPWLRIKIMDVLSDALSTVRMNAAIFFDASFTAPWGFKAPRAETFAADLAPGVEHIVIFHLLTDGHAVVRMEGEADMSLAAGDIVIVPHGDPYTMSNGTPAVWRDGTDSIGRYRAGEMSTVHAGGGGETAKFVCGYFGCERQALRLFLAGLPRLIKVSFRGDASGAWLESSIQHLVQESASGRPGSIVLLSKMAEALFVEALRRYMEQLPGDQTGWLAGARDPLVGAALALMHNHPCRQWTLPGLAAATGTSRTVLSERFVHFLGESPMAYLSRWRLRLAAQLLRGDRRTMMQVAMDVGYESEAAFNRAFKREFGLPPAQYRRAAMEQAAPPAMELRRGQTHAA
jgi:AraC-like DNA-binding protein